MLPEINNKVRFLGLLLGLLVYCVKKTKKKNS